MLVSHRNIIMRIVYIRYLYLYVIYIYCSIHIIELLLLMMCLNKYFQPQQQQQQQLRSQEALLEDSLQTIAAAGSQMVTIYSDGSAESGHSCGG